MDIIRPSKDQQRPGALSLLAVIALIIAVLVQPARANNLEKVMADIPLDKIFSGASDHGPFEGNPGIAPVYKQGKLAGYLFLTSDVIKSVGYSGKPIHTLVGLDLKGIITGTLIAAHREPIFVLGISDKELDQFLSQFVGLDIREKVRLGKARSEDERGIDMISGASITSLVFKDSIIRAARKVAQMRGILGHRQAQTNQKLDLETYQETNWQGLIRNGGLRHFQMTVEEVKKVITEVAGSAAAVMGTDSDATFIDLYTAVVPPPTIGQNLLGFSHYSQLMADLYPGESVIFVGATGLYSFRGYKYRKSGVFDRIQLVQGRHTIPLTQDMHTPLRDALPVKGAPNLRELSLFRLPEKTGFDPTQPWRLEILVERNLPGGDPVHAILPMDYRLPADFIIQPEPAPGPDHKEKPLWIEIWKDNVVGIVVVLLTITVLVTMLLFQDSLVRQKRKREFLRRGFLFFTLIVIGFTLNAQLSVINVLTFIEALRTDFDWNFFLLEPLIFILWGFVAVAILFWGRGVFCGWLCPFGAFQELINRIAKVLKVKQIDIPFHLHERLWAIKYVAFLAILALSLSPEPYVETALEIEPFKTAIALKFVRAWPFVLFAVGCLLASLFIQRFFCRYLCPLGAALAIPARNRMFDWFERRHQCGRECNICAVKCPVQAIHKNGQINAHECIYCLDCQSHYYDDTLCPPLVARKARREKALQMSAETTAHE